MPKKIIMDIRTDGKIETDFDHFVGNECYAEADILKARLKALGLNLEIEHIEPKKTETELRRLETPARAGR